MLFTNTLVETYTSLAGLSYLLIWEGGEREGDNVQVEVGRTSNHPRKGSGVEITEGITKHCNRLLREVVKSLCEF